MCYSVLAPSII